MAYPPRRKGYCTSRPRWPALGCQQSKGLLRSGGLQLWIVQCLTNRSRDLQRFPGERVSEGGKRQDVVGQRPAIRIRERVMEGGHRCSAQARREGPVDVSDRRAGLELAAREVRGVNGETRIIRH